MTRFDVLLFAAARDLAGAKVLPIEMPTGATAADALATIARACPALAVLAARSRLAVNHEYADAERALIEGDELALIPPVSGG